MTVRYLAVVAVVAVGCLFVEEMTTLPCLLWPSCHTYRYEYIYTSRCVDVYLDSIHICICIYVYQSLF